LIEDSLLLVLVANVNSQQKYVFAMNNKASPPSTNTSNKCSYLFPYFPSLEGRLAGEHAVTDSMFSGVIDNRPDCYEFER
jgi:hypothetical protein